MLDGGYFDNYGIFSLVEWLHTGLKEMQSEAAAPAANPPFPKILLVRLNGFGVSQSSPTSPGWRSQITDPASGFLNARDMAQTTAGDTVLNILHDELSHMKSGPDGHGVELVTVDFRYTTAATAPPVNRVCESAPLNWVLTEIQKKCLEDVWDAQPELQKSQQTVLNYLRDDQ
jgi:hypothetical protein